MNGLVVASILLTLSMSLALASRHMIRQESEVAEAVPHVRQHIPDGAMIFARKPHLAFYTAATPRMLPDLGTLTDLRSYLQSETTDEGPIYVFYGRDERNRREQYMQLADPNTRLDWLVEVVRSPRPGDWVLFRYDEAS